MLPQGDEFSDIKSALCVCVCVRERGGGEREDSCLLVRDFL